MRTDKQVYEILEAYPPWLFELTGLPSPGPCRFQSMTLKAIERRTDGVLVPDAEHEPLSVVELQMQFDPTVYNRIAIEMALIQEQYNQRSVQGIIIFLTASIDPKTPPWNKIVQVFYLSFSILQSDQRLRPCGSVQRKITGRVCQLARATL